MEISPEWILWILLSRISLLGIRHSRPKRLNLLTGSPNDQKNDLNLWHPIWCPWALQMTPLGHLVAILNPNWPPKWTLKVTYIRDVWKCHFCNPSHAKTYFLLSRATRNLTPKRSKLKPHSGMPWNHSFAGLRCPPEEKVAPKDQKGMPKWRPLSPGNPLKFQLVTQLWNRCPHGAPCP